jgi:hypothetical protein
MKKMLGVLLTVAMVLLFAASASAQICSTFDTDLEAWTCDTSGCSWAATGGNPDGHLRFDEGGDGTTEAIAPDTFWGDWTDLDGVGNIFYDHSIISEGTGVFGYDPYYVRISGPGGSAEWEGDTPSGATSWLLITAPLVESEWTVTSGTWSALLADVTDLRIRIELVQNSGGANDEVDGIDNVCLHTKSGPCKRTAEASTYGSIPPYGAADLGVHLIYLLIPVGAIVMIRIRRRKR